jgi:hypothetical protein
MTFCTVGHAQEFGYLQSNKKSLSLTYSLDTIELDTNSIIFLYAVIDKDTIWESFDLFEIDDKELFQEKYPEKELIVHFRVLSVNFNRSFRRLDTQLIQSQIAMDYIGFSYNQSQSDDPMVDFKSLNYSGSFSRGVSVGNRQSLVLNSSLNLQLSGFIGEDVELLAAISDNNIPIQPEGNTQQLQEFDRIFIELRKNQSTLRAGDFEVTRPNSYFLNYFKRSQGVKLAHVQGLKNGDQISSNGSFAISKGKFRRQFITAIEGNQGPYRLIGNDGETFIIVLANTEKVYLDGELLKRGLELDYVIDYNRGELLFTAKRLITKELRIIIEFEYSDQQYLRSMYSVNTAYDSKKWQMRFSVFSEQDNPNSPGNQFLSDEDKLFLSTIGDRVEEAVVNSIREPDQDIALSNPILYELLDTVLIDGRNYSGILRYSINSEIDRKIAVFTDFGQGNGNYVISNNLANGRVYEWIAPDPISGQPRGRFEPQARIVTPKQQSMMTLGGTYKISDRQEFNAEFAVSNFDINRFSNLDSGNDQGTAFVVNYKGAFNLDTAGRFRIIPLLTYENKGMWFKAVNPYRNQEFNRDWNIQQDTTIQEHVITGGVRMEIGNDHILDYQLTGFIQESIYEGFRHQYNAKTELLGTTLRVYGSDMRSSGLIVNNHFARPRIEIRRNIGLFEIGVHGERERSKRENPLTDRLLDGSFSWDIGRVFVKTDPEKPLNFQLSYTARADQFPIDGVFITATTASEWRFDGAYQHSKNGRLMWTFSARDLQVKDTSQFEFLPLRTYLGRITYNINAWKNTLRYTATYELGSGQEPKLEFVYLEVRPGEGQYIWTDRNGDGVQQLDEFEISPFQDQANFVRVATLTTEFTRTNNVLFNQQFMIDPRQIWMQKQGWKKRLSRLSYQSNLNIGQKTIAGQISNFWNPLQVDFESDAIVNGSLLSRQSVFFNRANPIYEIQLNYIGLLNRILLTTGFEKRNSSERQINVRYNPFKRWSIQSAFTGLSKANEAESFITRNYNILGWEAKQEVSCQIKSGFRASGKWIFNRQENQLFESGENADIAELSIQSVYNSSTNFAMRVELSYAKVAFNGETNSAVEFAMLDGLRDGNNVLWNVQFERSMINNVQLQLNYEGRKTGTSGTVHIGRVQLKATF